MTAPAKPKYRSVSQLQQYKKCPQSYYLARIEKAWKRPAAWLVQGSAVHEAAEAWEKSGRTMTLEEVIEVFETAFYRYANEFCATTKNFEWWFASGRYGGREDLSRRLGIGRDQVGRFIDYHLAHPEHVIWVTPDGTPAAELEFNFELDGIPIRGFIDAVREVNGELRVVDYKTGNRLPEDDFQLGVYKVALEVQFGVIAPKGEYWMGKSGKPTYPYDLSDWTVETVGEKFRELEDNLQAERFDPNPSSENCMFCDVSYSCQFATT